MINNQHQLNQQQYRNKSEAYLNSQAHAQGIEFAKMQDMLQQQQYQRVLDLGCGGGHVSYQVAPFVEQVVAYDLSAEMVDLVVKQAELKALDNVIGEVGPAESLAFADQYFDAVISRYSAHHWQHVGQALQQVHRVLKPKGRVVFFDIVGSSDPILDTFLQSIEVIRDPSHVRDYSVQEWVQMAEYAGFQIERMEKQSLKLDFQSWVERMQTPIHAIETIRYLQKNASDAVQQYYQIQADGTFVSQALYLELSKI